MVISRAQPHAGLSRSILRAAFDVGSLDAITVTIGSVHTDEKILRRLVYHSAVPLGPPDRMLYGGVITPQGRDRLENTFLQIGALCEMRGYRPREAAGIVCGPLAQASNAQEVFQQLSQQFFVRFCFPSPEQLEQYAHDAYAGAAGITTGVRSNILIWSELNDRVCIQQREESIQGRPVKLHTWDTGYTALDVHSMLLEHYQGRRDPTTGSCNPVNVSEAKALIHDLTEALLASRPPWLSKKVENFDQRQFVGAARNGATLNILTRAVRVTDIHLRALMETTYLRYCGVTDSWFARSFPDPPLVIPRLCLGIAVLQSLGFRRVRYVPEIAPTFGVLLDPAMYAEGREQELVLQRAMDNRPMHFGQPWHAKYTAPHVDPRQPTSNRSVVKAYRTLTTLSD